MSHTVADIAVPLVADVNSETDATTCGTHRHGDR